MNDCFPPPLTESCSGQHDKKGSYFFLLQETVVWHKSNKIDGTVSIVLFGVVALIRTGIIKCVQMRIEMSTTEFKVADRSPKR